MVIDTGRRGRKFAFANPKIVWSSTEMVKMNEGCLSIPGVEGEVVRPESIRIKADDPFTGTPVEMELTGLPARVFQHELDHLNGILFIDHLPALERSMIERKLQELAAA